jgi:hypothetical protein
MHCRVECSYGTNPGRDFQPQHGAPVHADNPNLAGHPRANHQPEDVAPVAVWQSHIGANEMDG